MRLACATVFVTVNSRVPCLLMPPISVTINSDNISSITHHSLCLNGIKVLLHFVSTGMHQRSTTTLCVFYHEPCTYNFVEYTSTCKFGKRAGLHFFTHHFMCTTCTSDIQSLHVAHRPPMSPVGSLPVTQNA